MTRAKGIADVADAPLWRSRHDAGILKGMTPKQEFFVAHWIDCKNGAEAYRRAGYKPKTNQIAAACAEKLLRNAEIKEAINRGLAKQVKAVEEATVTDKAWVIRMLRENAERAAQARPVCDAAGQPTGEFRYDGAVVNRAVELIGKTLGMFDVKPPVPPVAPMPPAPTATGPQPHVGEPEGSDRIAALLAEARAARAAGAPGSASASN